METYRFVYEGGPGEIEEKKSRFIGQVMPVSSEEEAYAFIESIKKNSNHIIFLEGLPGCGKTNFINYLSRNILCNSFTFICSIW